MFIFQNVSQGFTVETVCSNVARTVMWPVSVAGSLGCVTEGVKLDGLA